MEHQTITKILQRIRPGCQWTVRGENIEWLDPNQPAPTAAELKEGKALVDAEAYREKRERDYPSITDQLDAIWKGGKAMEDMRAKILAVKAKYQKRP